MLAEQLVSRIAVYERPGLREFWITTVPRDSGSGIRDQMASVYDEFLQTLRESGLGLENVVKEKIFCRSTQSQVPILRELRQNLYCSEISRLPSPCTFLDQPPADAGHDVELQAYVVALDQKDVYPLNLAQSVPYGATFTVGKTRHIHLLGLTGSYTHRPGSFETRTHRMFERARAGLAMSEFDFRDVVRTWIYIPDIEADYDAFNTVRNAFFEEEDVRPVPASTGIQGAVYPEELGPGMDLYAIQGGDTEIRVMHAATMNEAPAYGSGFSRGMTVSFAGGTLAFVSGTASIDERGRIVHGGDLPGQIHCMLDNVDALLNPIGCRFEDAVSVTVYLKHPEYLDIFEREWRLRDFPSTIPRNTVTADVCRPGWLCEIELIAAVSG